MKLRGLVLKQIRKKIVSGHDPAGRLFDQPAALYWHRALSSDPLANGWGLHANCTCELRPAAYDSGSAFNQFLMAHKALSSSYGEKIRHCLPYCKALPDYRGSRLELGNAYR